MSDLVERLRESYEKDCFLMEVADEIERLQETNKILGQWVEDYQARIAELEKSLQEVLDDYEAYQPKGPPEEWINRPLHDPEILARARAALKE